MTHYHLFMGAANAAPMVTTQIDDYDESIRKFLKLTKSLFGGNGPWRADLTYLNLLEVSEYGEGHKMTVGTEMLCAQWVRCRRPCLSPSWN